MKYFKYLILLFIILIPIKTTYKQSDNICNNYLKIEAINFNKCLYTNELNSLDYGLEIFLNDPIVILGHSGSASNAVFNDLHKVSTKDIITLKLNNEVSLYEINNIYLKEKKNKLVLNEELILVTCSRTNLSKQIVVTAHKINQKS